jgi:hypothetical protein
MCRLSWSLGAWNSWNPHCLVRPYRDCCAYYVYVTKIASDSITRSVQCSRWGRDYQTGHPYRRRWLHVLMKKGSGWLELQRDTWNVSAWSKLHIGVSVRAYQTLHCGRYVETAVVSYNVPWEVAGVHVACWATKRWFRPENNAGWQSCHGYQHFLISTKLFQFVVDFSNHELL